jgi:hypothetical protein
MSTHPDDSATRNEGYKHPGVVFSPPDDSLRPEHLFAAQPSDVSAARTELLASVDLRLIEENPALSGSSANRWLAGKVGRAPPPSSRGPGTFRGSV